jgi:hypothetical protein
MKDISSEESRHQNRIFFVIYFVIACLLLEGFDLLEPFCLFVKGNPTAATGIAAAVVAYFALKNNIRHANVKNAIDFETTYKHNEKIVDASLVIKEIVTKENSETIASYGLEANFFSKEAKAFTTVFNEWERCANGIYYGVYDEDFLYGIYGSTVIFLHDKCKPYLDQRKKHNVRVFKRFLWLALRWKIRREAEKQ